MATTLATVADLVAHARVLLQDESVGAYRYSDNQLLTALNSAVMESQRLRPDLWLRVVTLPSYTVVDTTAVTIDSRYRMAFVYYIIGMAQLRDEEETTDARAAAYLTKFHRDLVGPVTGAGA